MVKGKVPHGRGFLVDEDGILTDGYFSDGKLEKKMETEDKNDE